MIAIRYTGSLSAYRDPERSGTDLLMPFRSGCFGDMCREVRRRRSARAASCAVRRSFGKVRTTAIADLLRQQCRDLTDGLPPSATFRGRGMPRFSVTVRSVRHRPSGRCTLKWLLQRCRRRLDEGGARLLVAERYAQKCKFGLSTSSQKRRKVSTFG